jgi:hypothetical protein
MAKEEKCGNVLLVGERRGGGEGRRLGDCVKASVRASRVTQGVSRGGYARDASDDTGRRRRRKGGESGSSRGRRPDAWWLLRYGFFFSRSFCSGPIAHLLS